MNDMDLHQGRNPEKVARDYEAVAKLAKWVIPIIAIGLIIGLFR